MADPFTLTLWTNDPYTAENADAAGVDRIGLDLEALGKGQRQKGRGLWMSPHHISEVPLIRRVVKKAELFVRCNPVNPGSRDEIEELTDGGVDVIMLPNFEAASDVARLLELVDGRARVVPLVERRRALAELGKLAAMHEIREIHVGLNDLSMDFGYSDRMAILASDMLAAFVARARALGLRVAVGGIARAEDDTLPIPSDIVYAQLAKLGAAGALVAASFHAEALGAREFAGEVRKLRLRMAHWRNASKAELDAAHDEFLKILGPVASCEVHA